MRTPRRLIRARRAMARLAARLPLPAIALPKRRQRPKVELEAVRRRLELLLTALYGRHIPIAPPESHHDSWWRRAVRSMSPYAEPQTVPASDGESLRLPPSIDATLGNGVALARYRLLAIEQGERVVRGTAALAARTTDQLERDLFLVRESAAIDAAIARTVRNVAPTLAAARAVALSRRPLMESLAGAERDVEGYVRQLLAADPAAPPNALSGEGSAADSLAWARATAARLRTSNERYRGISPVDLWGNVLTPSASALAAANEEPTGSIMNARLFNLVELAGAEESGQRRPLPADEGAESEAPLSGAQEQQRGAPESDDAGGAPLPGVDEQGGAGTGAAASQESSEPLTRDDLIYPEWDHDTRQYRRDAVIVRTRPAREDAPDWATETLQEHAALVRRVRERFERLRARRTRLPRQRDGDELDLAACVRALVDARSGHSVDDQLYVAVRPARRELAILLLVDVSGSTDTLVTKTLQVIDVEKAALLLAAEALDALGDRYAMLAFSGKGARSVRLTTIKSFAERNGPSVRGRISALAPEANTRLGAAIRHATSLLDGQTAGHRLLLILSDGKPNDADHYQGPYGIEDSRQAINEARARDVFPFCLTVDSEDSAYLKRIFGPSGYAILPRPDHLPRVLLDVVRKLLLAK
ncbi:MAG: nitric oxide reductase activation protein NorD [Gemmatimonadaceae bacterium]